MIVVSNTSPIINLAAIGHLELLRHLYGTIAIPQAVYHEIAVKGHAQAGAIEIQTSHWFERYQVQNTALVKHLEQELDAGEAEAIALAVELQVDLLLLDERRGRMAAKQLGIAVTGLLGILLVAKQREYLVAIKPVLHNLMTVAGFWIDQELYKRVLESAQEL
jgi:predicted nucleic acid-binding protein